MVKILFSFILLLSFSVPTALPGVFGHLQFWMLERERAALVDLPDTEQSENAETIPTFNDIEEKVVHIAGALKIEFLVAFNRIDHGETVKHMLSACVNSHVPPPPETNC
jgi:hypothetical protein